MASVRVKSIGNQLLIIIGGKTANFYDKEGCKWSALNGDIVFSYYENELYVEKFKAKPYEFIEPKEDSVYDLLLLLNDISVDIPAQDLTLSELEAIQNANNPSSSNPFATIDDLPSSTEFIFISSKDDLPSPVGGVITLLPNATYYFLANVDLLGDRLVGSANTTILGASSENCSITSTGLDILEPLFETDYTTPIRHITFKDHSIGIEINPSGLGVQPIALDWTGVNFSNTDISCIFGEIDNFIFSKGAILSAGAFIFSDNVGTIGIDNSLFVGDGTNKLIELQATCVVTRRFRVIYSSFVAFGSTIAIDANTSATIPTDSYILDTCNFSGGGTYLQGIGQFFTDNEPRFVNNKGILNTASVGNYYMSANATVTTITTIATPVKVLGTTTANAINQKFTHSNNRLTYVGELQKDFEIQAVASFTGGGQNKEIGLYVAKNGAVLSDSEMYATTDGNNKAQSISIQTITELSNTDYIEIWVENNSDTTDVTVEFLNVICKSLN
jgi:hypothetical protein